MFILNIHDKLFIPKMLFLASTLESVALYKEQHVF